MIVIAQSISFEVVPGITPELRSGGRAENRASLGSLTDRSGHRTRYIQDKIKLSIGLNFSKLSSLNTTGTPISKRVVQSVKPL